MERGYKWDVLARIFSVTQKFFLFDIMPLITCGKSVLYWMWFGNSGFKGWSRTRSWETFVSQTFSIYHLSKSLSLPAIFSWRLGPQKLTNPWELLLGSSNRGRCWIKSAICQMPPRSKPLLLGCKSENHQDGTVFPWLPTDNSCSWIGRVLEYSSHIPCTGKGQEVALNCYTSPKSLRFFTGGLDIILKELP